MCVYITYVCIYACMASMVGCHHSQECQRGSCRQRAQLQQVKPETQSSCPWVWLGHAGSWVLLGLWSRAAAHPWHRDAVSALPSSSKSWFYKHLCTFVDLGPGLWVLAVQCCGDILGINGGAVIPTIWDPAPAAAATLTFRAWETWIAQRIWKRNVKLSNPLWIPQNPPKHLLWEWFYMSSPPCLCKWKSPYFLITSSTVK